MKTDRTVMGTRIATPERIRNMSDGSLTLYRRTVRSARNMMRGVNKERCDCGYGCILSERPYTEEEIRGIRALDYVTAEILRELERRNA